MTWPVELTAGWQMALLCIGLYVLSLVLLIFRKQQSRLPTRKRLSRKRKQLNERFLDTSQPPSWWEWEDRSESSVQPASRDEEGTG